MAEDTQQPTFLGTTAERRTGSRQGFSRQAQENAPTLRRSYNKDADTLSPLLEQGANVGSETYIGIQSKRIENSKDEIQDLAYQDATGQISNEERRQLSQTNRLFEKYNDARTQGAMTDSAANIAIESELKRVSNQFPALGPQVRRAAAQSMGFDPTGAEYQFLTNPTAGNKVSETPLQKAVRNSSYAAEYLGIDPKVMADQVVNNYARGLEASSIEQKAAIGKMAAADIVNYMNIKSNETFLKVKANLFETMKTQGVGDIAALDATTLRGVHSQIKTMKRTAQNQLRKSLLGHPGIGDTELTSQVNNLGQKYDEFSESLDSFSITNVNNETMAERGTRVKMFAQDMFPLLTMFKSIGLDGDSAVRFTSALADPDNPLNKNLIMSDPMLQQMARNGNVGGALRAKLKAIYTGDVQGLARTSMGGDPTVDIKKSAAFMLNDPAASNVDLNGTPAGAKVLSMLHDTGNDSFALTKIEENPGQHVGNKGVVRYIQNITGDPELSRVADSIREEVGPDTQLEIKNGRIQIVGGNSVGNSESIAQYNVPNPGGDFGARSTRDYRAKDSLDLLSRYNRILGDASMRNQVGRSPQDIVRTINKQMKQEPKPQAQVQSTTEMQPVTEEEVAGVAVANGVNPTLLTNLVRQESAFGTSNSFSSAGAAGVVQFMAPTARDMGLRVDDEVDERLNNEKALNAGAKYLKKLVDRYDGDEVLGTMAYNWGMGNVDDLLRERSPSPSIPSETVDYATKITGEDPIEYLRRKRYIPTY